MVKQSVYLSPIGQSNNTFHFISVQGTKAWFVFQKLKYMCDMSEKKQFKAVDFPIAEPFKFYNDSKGLDDATISNAKLIYSTNA